MRGGSCNMNPLGPILTRPGWRGWYLIYCCAIFLGCPLTQHRCKLQSLHVERSKDCWFRLSLREYKTRNFRLWRLSFGEACFAGVRSPSASLILIISLLSSSHSGKYSNSRKFSVSLQAALGSRLHDAYRHFRSWVEISTRSLALTFCGQR